MFLLEKHHRQGETDPALEMDAFVKLGAQYFEPFYSTRTRNIHLSVPPVVVFGWRADSELITLHLRCLMKEP